jgi:RES domain
MDQLFAHLKLADIHRDVFRNIVSIHASQDLFDDLSEHPEDWVQAQQIEDEVKPLAYQSRKPVIDRPFEDALWFNAIAWPYQHWQTSRFSDGSFGVWYGCDSIETSVYETAYHWVNGLLRDAGFENENVAAQRSLYLVACDAALLDLRPHAMKHDGLLHKSDYSYTQAIGARLHREGHPGLVTTSARHVAGHNYAILNPNVLSNPRHHCPLSYQLDGNRIRIEKQDGLPWMEIATASF